MEDLNYSLIRRVVSATIRDPKEPRRMMDDEVVVLVVVWWPGKSCLGAYRVMRAK